jgi:hypothetical protein
MKQVCPTYSLQATGCLQHGAVAHVEIQNNKMSFNPIPGNSMIECQSNSTSFLANYDRKLTTIPYSEETLS